MEKELKKELTQDFIKYEKYIYSMLKTKTYSSKGVGKKVCIYNAEMLGYDFEDLIQQGRLFLWEALLNYGIFPEKSKNKERKIASKSTFVYKHLLFSFINLGIKANSKKYKRMDTELNESLQLVDCVNPEKILIFNEEYKKKIKGKIV